jgi:hypothetical protein
MNSIGWWIVAPSLAASVLGCGSVSAQQDAGSDGSGSSDGNQSSPAVLEISPLAHEFGAVAPNAMSAAVSFTFTNTGGSPATGCSAPTKGGANPGEFSIENDACGTMDLPANGSCVVTVAAKPTTAGAKTMTLSRTCTEGGTASTTADGLGANRPMFIFVTSTKHNGNLGGLAGADTICNNAGGAGLLTSGLNKSWKALLSLTTGGTTINAKDRFVWTGPLYNVNKELAVQNPASWPWVPANANAQINKNQNGGPPGDSYVWSGSTIDGMAKPNLDCNGWLDESSSFNGWAGQNSYFQSSKDWFDSFSNSCESQYFTLWCISL